MRKIKLFLLLLIFSFKTFADEGMWLPFLLETLNEKEMKAMGMKISAKDIYDINKGSLKDAIVQFGGGCTGEIISNQGLVLTNHHCGFGAIQRLSSLTNNYVNDGFWSKSLTEELPAPGVTVTFISKMEDVTKIILAGVIKNLSEQERQSIIDKNINAYKATLKNETYETVSVRPFYNGNMYIMIVSVVYSDIRLVGAPPQSIGAFGADTDNWVWPRHGGDFSVFRIYADANNKPAAYSASNVPYKPKKSLNIAMTGVKENDFTMVFGFPGRTNEYLPAIAVQQTLEKNNPIKINIRDEVLKAQKNYMQQDAAIKLQYASKYAGIANAWKKWIGENLGLQQSNAVQKKLNYEKLFTQKVNANPQWKEAYGTILTDLNKLYKDAEDYFYVRDAINETINNCEILTQALSLTKLEDALEKDNDKAIEAEKTALMARMKSFYKDYSAKVDEGVLAKVLDIYFNKVNNTYHSDVEKIWNNHASNTMAIAKNIFENSFLTSAKSMETFLALSKAEMKKTLMTDKAYSLAAALREQYVNLAADQTAQLQSSINSLQRQYMEAQMIVMAKQRKFYPDANSSLRITYGNVKGYKPKDGVTYHYYTYLDGVMEKYVRL
jgi:hypothetical protein